MAKKRSNVDIWLERETPRVRKTLESASRNLGEGDHLTVHTLEAIYGQESSFGTLMGNPGSDKPAGHFQLEKPTAKRYGLSVSKKKDERFDLERAASAAARDLIDLNKLFSGKARLGQGKEAVSVRSVSERKKFVLGAFNAGEGRIVRAQYLAAGSGKNPQLWNDVRGFIEAAGGGRGKNQETQDYVETILLNENEFSLKSKAGRDFQRKFKQSKYRCDEDEGSWRTIGDRPVLICDKKTT